MIITLKDLYKLREKFKNKTIVFAGGVFDLLHIAHIRTFKKLHSYGDIVVIGIVSDKRVKERKGKNRPILSQIERREIIDAIKYVDYVVQMPDPNKLAPIPTMSVLTKLKPDIFVRIDERWKKYKNSITNKCLKLKILKRIHPTSTSVIIERVIKKYKA